MVFLIIYVDDGLIAAKTDELVKRLVRSLKTNF